MNRTLNQLINQLHLDPKKEAAVRKIVENAVSNNSGGYTDMMVLNTRDNSTLTEEQFNEIEERVKNGCLFELQFHETDDTTTYYSQGIKYKIDSNNCWYIFNGNFGVSTKDVSYAGDIVFIAVKSPYGYAFDKVLFDGSLDLVLPVLRTPKFYYTGNGTKFLSDDGTYKEVSGGNGPVTIETNLGDEGFEDVQLTDQQFEACKNSNVKIKVNTPDSYMILIPYFYGFQGEDIVIFVRQINPAGNIGDVTFSVNINSKLLHYIS